MDTHTSRNGCDSQGTMKKAYLHKPGTEPLQMITTGQLLDQASQKWPDREAIVSPHEEKSLNYLLAKVQAEQLGAGFLKLGLKPGDRLAILGVNSVHWYLTTLAAAKAGLISVFLNPAYRDQELYSGLKLVEAKGIVMDHKYKTQDYPSMLMSLLDNMSLAPHGQPLRNHQLPNLSWVIVATEEKLPGCYRFQDVLSLTKDTEEIEAIERQIQPEGPAFIMFSSGTTGTPKGTVLSHFGLINNCIIAGRRIGSDYEKSTVCIQIPFFHVFGSSYGIIGGLYFGNTMILAGPMFKPQYTVDVLQNYKCDIMFGTPSMFIDLCNELNKYPQTSVKLKEGCSNLKMLFCGASSCPSEVFRDMLNKFPNSNLMYAYGLTEISCTGFLTYLKDSFKTKTKTVGHLLEHTEVKIVDSNGEMVSFNTPGEVWFRSYGVLLDYWKDKKRTEEIKTPSGWLKSGDVMILKEDGYAEVVGRTKDIINRGGENVSPVEIEDFLMHHPQIVNAQVYGVFDERMGEEVAASIQLNQPNSLSELSLKEYCRGKISHFKIPKHIRFVNQFPLTTSGKFKKDQLREEHEKELKQQLIKLQNI